MPPSKKRASLAAGRDDQGEEMHCSSHCRELLARLARRDATIARLRADRDLARTALHTFLEDAAKGENDEHRGDTACDYEEDDFDHVETHAAQWEAQLDEISAQRDAAIAKLTSANAELVALKCSLATLKETERQMAKPYGPFPSALHALGWARLMTSDRGMPQTDITTHLRAMTIAMGPHLTTPTLSELKSLSLFKPPFLMQLQSVSGPTADGWVGMVRNTACHSEGCS